MDNVERLGYDINEELKTNNHLNEEKPIETIHCVFFLTSNVIES